MGDLINWFKSSTILQGAPTMTLPPVARDFAISKEKTNPEQWKSVNDNAVMLNFTTNEFAMKRASDLEKEGTHYVEILDDKGKFQRAFATVENPQKKGEFRLFEIPYQYFDGDKVNGKAVEDSTGFKMCAAVEHVLPNHSKAEADKIIQSLTVLPSQPRNLVKDENGKVVQTWSIGGWTKEVGGGFNAWEIEHGRYPLQWKNLLGMDGKPRAIDDALGAMKKIGVELDAKDGNPGSTIELTGQSMGTPNTQMARYLLEKYYGQDHVKCMEISGMAQGQTLKQLTEIEYNLENKNISFTHLKDLKGDEQAKAEKIAVAIHDSDNLTTVYSSDNYFAHYNVNGNGSINSAPGLPGDNMLLVKSDETPKGWSLLERDSFADHGERIFKDHLLPAFNTKMTLGSSELTPAVYKPKDHNLHDALFKDVQESKCMTEEMLIGGLHKFNEGKDRAIYGLAGDGSIAHRAYTTIFGTGREPLTDSQVYKAVANYKPAEPAQDITKQLSPTEVTQLQELQSQTGKQQQSR